MIASSRSGYQHLFRYNYNGTLAKQITKGEWNVSAFLGYDEKSRSYFYESNQEGPLYKAIYKINEKGIETKLSERIGTNQASFNPSCTYFINKYSNSNEPLLVTVYGIVLDHISEKHESPKPICHAKNFLPAPITQAIK